MLKLPNSIEPAVMAENIVHLRDGLAAVDAKTLPDTTTATTGQILKLTGENKTPAWADEYSYTPPAYSTTEVNTGQKWIDGRDVYCKVYSGGFPTLESAASVNLEITSDYEDIISFFLRAVSGSGNNITLTYNAVCVPSTGQVYIYNVPPVYSERPYVAILYYVKKATPAPETREDDTEPEPEPEEKKTTKKKTTK